MSNNDGPLSLKQYLDETFIIPSGKTLKWWAQKLGLSYSFFHTLMRTHQGSISVAVIVLFARELNIDPRKLIRMQNEFLLKQYINANSNNVPIDKIVSRIRAQDHLVMEVLLSRFHRPLDIRLTQLVSHIKIERHSYHNFFSLRHAYFNYTIPGRLGDALGTGPKFWLDLQTKHDMDIYLNENPIAKKYLVFTPDLDFRSSESNLSSPESPGSVIEKRFLKPSRIPHHHWADFFCMGSETFQRFLDGRNLMDFRFISLLVKAFDLPAAYWINLQNEYLSHKYLVEDSPSLQIKLITTKLVASRRTSLGNILIHQHLKPLGWSFTDFGMYITGQKFFGPHLVSGHDRVGIERAVKFSQALGTTPMYWLDLQMEEDLSVPIRIYKGKTKPMLISYNRISAKE
ncbi:MAG: hypothetical protein ACK5WF_23760 [Cyclobacteriaceae bacterium]